MAKENDWFFDGLGEDSLIDDEEDELGSKWPWIIADAITELAALIALAAIVILVVYTLFVHPGI